MVKHCNTRSGTPTWLVRLAAAAAEAPVLRIQHKPRPQRADLALRGKLAQVPRHDKVDGGIHGEHAERVAHAGRGPGSVGVAGDGGAS